MLEASDLHPGRTGAITCGSWLAPLACRARRVDEVLALVDLSGAADRRVAGYSLGMRQRLGLAAALLGDPELLILDEPANGLDPEGVRWLRDFLRAFAAEGRTVLVSSHHLAEVAQTVDRVVIINRGRLVAESPLSELTARSPGPCASRPTGRAPWSWRCAARASRRPSARTGRCACVARRPSGSGRSRGQPTSACASSSPSPPRSRTSSSS